MLIWTIKEGEPLPIEGYSGRIMRCGMISSILAKRGNSVVWWTSSFFHQTKQHYFNTDVELVISENLKLKVLHSKVTYKKNVSFKRLIYSKHLGKRFAIEARKALKPDAIFCAYPLIDFAYEAVRYGLENDIPVIIDIRDLWPDIFIQPFPQFISRLLRVVLFSFFRKAEYCIKNATIITGVVPYCLEWAKEKGRKQDLRDKVVYLAYDNKEYSKDVMDSAKLFWKNLGIEENDTVACYFGNISSRIIDFNTILKAARILVSVKFVICGTGPFLKKLNVLASDLQNVILPGYIGQEQIQELMKISIFGLLPYYNTEDFINAIPNKVIEYMAGELIIVNSLNGLLSTLVAKYDCGITYANAKTLVKKLEVIINDKKKISKMKRNSYNLYKEKFMAVKVYGDFCDFIEKI